MRKDRLRLFRSRSSGRRQADSGRSRGARAVVVASALGLVVGALLTLVLLHGPILLDVRSPGGDLTVGLEGVEVWVQFDPVRTRSSTFRVLLNGADVTDQLDVAENGAIGSLHGLLDGENELRLEVMGEALWPRSLLVQEARTYRVLFRRPVESFRG